MPPSRQILVAIDIEEDDDNFYLGSPTIVTTNLNQMQWDNMLNGIDYHDIKGFGTDLHVALNKYTEVPHPPTN